MSIDLKQYKIYWYKKVIKNTDMFVRLSSPFFVVNNEIKFVLICITIKNSYFSRDLTYRKLCNNGMGKWTILIIALNIL